jgi:hypothetical protein
MKNIIPFFILVVGINTALADEIFIPDPEPLPPVPFEVYSELAPSTSKPAPSTRMLDFNCNTNK